MFRNMLFLKREIKICLIGRVFKSTITFSATVTILTITIP